jgi:hypothetical protein
MLINKVTHNHDRKFADEQQSASVSTAGGCVSCFILLLHLMDFKIGIM